MQVSQRSRIKCYFDGACPGNQFGTKGPMKAAYVVGNEGFVFAVPDIQTPQGPLRSNNIAEYHGLIFLLRHLHDLESKRDVRGSYLVCGDSQLVIRQMLGEYRVKKSHLLGLYQEASRLASGLDIELRHVPRKENPAGFLLERNASA